MAPLPHPGELLLRVRCACVSSDVTSLLNLQVDPVGAALVHSQTRRAARSDLPPGKFPATPL